MFGNIWKTPGEGRIHLILGYVWTLSSHMDSIESESKAPRMLFLSAAIRQRCPIRRTNWPAGTRPRRGVLDGLL